MLHVAVQAEKEKAVAAAAKEAAEKARSTYKPSQEELKELVKEPLSRLMQLLYFGEVGGSLGGMVGACGMHELRKGQSEDCRQSCAQHCATSQMLVVAVQGCTWLAVNTATPCLRSCSFQQLYGDVCAWLQLFDRFGGRPIWMVEGEIQAALMYDTRMPEVGGWAVGLASS
jgi:hypothetical protein